MASADDISDVNKAKVELVRKLVANMGKVFDDSTNPELALALEGMVATGAMRAYATVKTFQITESYCQSLGELGVKFNKQLELYRDNTKEEIELATIYYRDGFDFKLKDKHLKKTGEEITEALNEHLSIISEKYNNYSEEELREECKNTIDGMVMMNSLLGK